MNDQREKDFEAIVTMLISFRGVLDLYKLTGDPKALEALSAGIQAALDKAQELRK